MERRLYRSREDNVIAGVCGGIAEFFGWDPGIVRVITALAVFVGGVSVLPYIVLWIIIPERPKHLSKKNRYNEEETEDRYGKDYSRDEAYDTEYRYEESHSGRYDDDYDEDHDYEDRPKKKRDNTMIVGLGFLAVGGWILLERLLPINLGMFFWPGVLIAIGFMIIARRKGEE